MSSSVWLVLCLPRIPPPSLPLPLFPSHYSGVSARLDHCRFSLSESHNGRVCSGFEALASRSPRPTSSEPWPSLPQDCMTGLVLSQWTEEGWMGSFSKWAWNINWKASFISEETSNINLLLPRITTVHQDQHLTLWPVLSFAHMYMNGPCNCFSCPNCLQRDTFFKQFQCKWWGTKSTALVLCIICFLRS